MSFVGRRTVSRNGNVVRNTVVGVELKPPARVRVLHDVAKGPNVDIYIDGSRALSNVPFRANSDYKEVPAGVHTVEVKAHPSTAASQALITKNINLAEAANTPYYTVIAHGDASNLSSLDLLLVKDRDVCPAVGTTTVRFVHSAATVPAVDVYLNGAKTLSNRAYGSTTNYLEVPAGEAQIQVNVAGTNQAVLGGTLLFESGTNYTIYAAGLVGDRDAPLEITMLEDSSGMCYMMQ